MRIDAPLLEGRFKRRYKRFFADVDSDDNAFDFAVLDEPTPGTALLSVPEPSTGLLAFTALAVFAAKGRRFVRERFLGPPPEPLTQS